MVSAIGQANPYAACVEDFYLAVREHCQSILDTAWTDSSADIMKAKIRQLAREQASRFGLSRDASEVMAEYAIRTIQLDGVPLNEATVDNIAHARSVFGRRERRW